jgi:hypothetical protein
MTVLTVLTVNIGAASQERARLESRGIVVNGPPTTRPTRVGYGESRITS